jgi:ankyrin repeat protein
MHIAEHNNQADLDADQQRQEKLGQELIDTIATAAEAITTAKSREIQQQHEQALACKIRKLLAEGANVNTYKNITLKMSDSFTPMLRYKVQGAVWLFNYEETTTYTALQLAALYGLTSCLDILLCADAKVDWPAGRQTALHYAATRGHLDCVKHLVAAGATINARDTYNFTPYAHAVAAKQASVAAYLLEVGACTTLANEDGGSIIYIRGNPTTAAEDNELSTAIHKGTKMNIVRHNWARVAVTTSFVRANRTNELKYSIFPLISEIKKFAGLSETKN